MYLLQKWQYFSVFLQCYFETPSMKRWSLYPWKGLYGLLWPIEWSGNDRIVSEPTFSEDLPTSVFWWRLYRNHEKFGPSSLIPQAGRRLTPRGWDAQLMLAVHRWTSVCPHAQCWVSCNLSQSCGLWPARLLCPWGFPGRDTGVGHRFLLQGIVLTQGANQHLLHWQAISLPLSHLGSLSC